VQYWSSSGHSRVASQNDAVSSTAQGWALPSGRVASHAALARIMTALTPPIADIRDRTDPVTMALRGSRNLSRAASPRKLPHPLDEVEPAAAEPCLAARTAATTPVFIGKRTAIGDVGVEHEPPAHAGRTKASASSWD